MAMCECMCWFKGDVRYGIADSASRLEIPQSQQEHILRQSDGHPFFGAVCVV
jgi:hypothetical protein